ncbi:unnamed protein product, partial [Thlaspi arvense]
MSCFSCLNTRTNDMPIDTLYYVTDNSSVDTRSDSTRAGSKSGILVNGKVNSPKPGGGARSFTFKELADATKNFKEVNMIGKGGFGSVYKGRLYSGQVVAIKQLNPDGHQGNQEFIVEVLMLSVFHHPNLVTLIGYCTSGAQRLLVYEYMPMGSLEDHLYDLEPDQKPLSWNTRMKIAVGAARGIEYLHCKISPSVIYRDLKSANILLDREFHPKLSDFGLAKARPYLKDPTKFGHLVDPLLRGNYPKKCLSYAIAITEMCLNEEANRRPKIGDVLVAFEYIAAQSKSYEARRAARKSMDSDRSRGDTKHRY